MSGEHQRNLSHPPLGNMYINPSSLTLLFLLCSQFQSTFCYIDQDREHSLTSTRYYLKEQRLSGKKPENSKELFNLRHSSLRNVIERIFGVLKRKYQILRTPSEYSLETQSRIILACVALHNQVRSKEGDRADIYLDAEREGEGSQDIQPAIVYPQGVVTSKKIDTFRDKLAERMWDDYKRYINSGGSNDVTSE